MDLNVSVSLQERTFAVILSIPGNQICADCTSSSPDWASINLGVLICHKCSGVHRSIGVHITRVKSTKLDSWTVKQMFIINHVNNQEANSYWEVNLPHNFVKPDQSTTSEDLKNFIYSKYVRKEFINPNTKPPLEPVSATLSLDSNKNGLEGIDQFYKRKIVELENMLRNKSLLKPGAEIRPFGLSSVRQREGKSMKSLTPMARNTRKDITFTFPDLDNSEQNIRNIAQRTFLSVEKDVLDPISEVEGEKRPRRMTKKTSLNLFNGLTLKNIQLQPPQRKLLKSSTIIDRDFDDMFGSPRNGPNFRFATTYSKDDIDKAGPRIYNPPRIPGASIELSDGTRKSSKDSTPNEIDEETTSAFRIASLTYMHEEETEREKMRANVPKQSTSEFIIKNIKKFSERVMHRANSTPMEKPFFLNVASDDMQEFGSHLKRPSEDFEMVNMNKTGFLPNNTRNLIKPCNGYPKAVILAGAFIVHLALGYLYCWGGISPYLTFFFKQYYRDGHYLDVASYSSLILLTYTLGYTFTERFIDALGFRQAILAAFLGISFILALCSFAAAPVLYSSVLTFIIGFFLGLAYRIPYYCAIQYFTTARKKLKFAFYFANSIGAFLFAYSCGYVLETNSFHVYAPDVDFDKDGLYEDGDNITEYYSQVVTAKVPDLVLLLAVVFFFAGIIGGLLLKPRFNFVEKEWSALEKKEGLLAPSKVSLATHKKKEAKMYRDTKHALTSATTRNLLRIVIFTCPISSYYLFSYKVVGLQLGFTDGFLTLLGGVGLLSVAVGKAVAVFAYKRFSFKPCIRAIMICYAILGIVATVGYEYLIVYFIPLMLIGGFTETIVYEEVFAKHTEDTEPVATIIMMIGFVLTNFLGFLIVIVCERFMPHRYINLVLILPIIRSTIAEKKYGSHVRDTASLADSEIERILAD